MRIWKVILLTLLGVCLIFTVLADEITTVTLADNASSCSDERVVVMDNVITIKEPGEYMLTGSLSDGQIRVDCAEEGKVILYLNGVSVHHEDGSAIYVGHVAPRIKISLNSGTDNELSNGFDLAYEVDDEPNGVIFSRSDLSILGDGSLKIFAGAMDGIVSKDDLRIENGILDIHAARHGIKGKDSIEISGGKINIQAGKDGLKSTNDKDPARGYIEISGGDISIVCGDDPVAYITEMNITDARVHTQIISDND